MKTSLSHLPERKQDDLKTIVSYMVENIPSCEMIILYGSYATGKFVEYDQRVEFGWRTSFMSDYDILLLTSNTDQSDHYRILRFTDEIENYVYKFRPPHESTPIHIISETINQFNRAIRRGLYFYTDIIKEGILLYDSGRYTIEPLRELNYREIKDLAELFFNEKFERANDFLINAQFNYENEKYRMASFMLHQAVENSMYAIIATHTINSPKEHSITKLFKSAKSHTLRLSEVFTFETAEDRRLFELLEKSYIQSRYNFEFIVTKEDIEALINLTEKLLIVVKEVCLKKIQEFERLAEQS